MFNIIFPGKYNEQCQGPQIMWLEKGQVCGYIKNIVCGSVFKHQPLNQNVTASTPSQGTCQHLGLDTQ